MHSLHLKISRNRPLWCLKKYSNFSAQTKIIYINMHMFCLQHACMCIDTKVSIYIYHKSFMRYQNNASMLFYTMLKPQSK